MKQPDWLEYHIADGVTAFSTTRHGGVSKGNYAEFNVNEYCGDDKTCIEANRMTLCRRLGITTDRLVYPHQVHGTVVKAIGPEWFSWSPNERKEYLEGVDAVMTDLTEASEFPPPTASPFCCMMPSTMRAAPSMQGGGAPWLVS